MPGSLKNPKVRVCSCHFLKWGLYKSCFAATGQRIGYLMAHSMWSKNHCEKSETHLGLMHSFLLRSYTCVSATLSSDFVWYCSPCLIRTRLYTSFLVLPALLAYLTLYEDTFFTLFNLFFQVTALRKSTIPPWYMILRLTLVKQLLCRFRNTLR